MGVGVGVWVCVVCVVWACGCGGWLVVCVRVWVGVCVCAGVRCVRVWVVLYSLSSLIYRIGAL